MDIVVQLENGSIVNLEVQKIGYKFPGSRSACYSADLLLRQYRRVRSQNNTFSYKDIKGVYTIVLFETSPKEFNTSLRATFTISGSGREKTAGLLGITAEEVEQAI